MSETNYLQVQTCDHCHKPLYIVAGSPRVTVWEDGNVRNYHFKCIDPSYVVPHPDTGDTAALEMPKWVIEQVAIGRQHTKMYRGQTALTHWLAIVWFADHVAALVQAETERCAEIAEDRALVEWHPAMLEIAKRIRARSTPTPPTDG